MKDGLSRLDSDGRLTNYTYKNSALNTTCITDIAFCTRSRRLYVATSTGLCFVDEKGTIKPAADHPDDGVRLSQLHIRTLATDGQGNIYAGTDQGIRVYDRTFKPLATLLHGSEILALAADRAGRVFATTARGIYRVSPTKGCKGIGREHGLAQVGLAKYALCCTPDGEVLAGGLGRFVRLTDAEKLFADSCKPLLFTELRINGERMTDGDSTLTLGSYGRLLVSVSTLDYGRASTVVFAYRLDDGQWQSVSGNTFTLENLSVGNHLLTVQASDGSVAMLTLRVPWWRSAWGLVFLCIIVGSGGFWLRRGWRNRRKSSQSIVKWNAFSPNEAPAANDKAAQIEPNIGRSADDSLSPADKVLLDKATAIVEAHLADNNFSVEAFGEAMCMSRSALYKKLTAAAGRSPIEFMRGIRLERGRQLLEQGHTGISEIATRVGMSPKQFSRFFREQYGVLPSEYRQPK